MNRIKCYETEEKDLFLFVSHKSDGTTNSSYALVNADRTVMAEAIPGYGPITRLESDSNIIDKYLENNMSLDRSNWTQYDFDESNFNQYLSEGDLKEIKNILSRYLY